MKFPCPMCGTEVPHEQLSDELRSLASFRRVLARIGVEGESVTSDDVNFALTDYLAAVRKVEDEKAQH